MTASLQRRLLARTIAAMLLLLAIFSAVLYIAFRRALVTQFDQSLLATARVFAAAVEIDLEQDRIDIETNAEAAFTAPQARDMYALYSPGGSLISRSPAASLSAPPVDAVGSIVYETTSPDNRPLRAVVYTFAPRVELPDPPGESAPAPVAAPASLTLVLARDASNLRRQLSVLGALLLSLSAAVALIAVAIAAVVVRRGLRPLTAVAARIAHIDPDDLAARVPAADAPAELRPIIDQLNALLARLEQAFLRQRRFTADAAHELRTPLSGLRTTVEVALTRLREPGEYAAVLRDCLEMTTRMQSLVAGLLTLARFDAGKAKPVLTDIRPAPLIEAWLAEARDRLRARRLAVESAVPADLACRADPDLLALILHNVLDNAADYTRAPGSIQIGAYQSDAAVTLEIANTPVDLAPDDLPRIFEPFWRADPARADTETHAGLGLSLVQKAAKAINARIATDLTDQTFRLTITLPANGSTQSPKP